MSELGPSCEHAPGCITCGDVAEPMRVTAVDGDHGLAMCSGGGEPVAVEVALVEPVAVGDLLLVHAGTAIAHAEEERR